MSCCALSQAEFADPGGLVRDTGLKIILLDMKELMLSVGGCHLLHLLGPHDCSVRDCRLALGGTIRELFVVDALQVFFLQ